MVVYHDEVEIEDFEYDEDEDLYHYPCPCGDRFEITKVLLRKQTALKLNSILTFRALISAFQEDLIAGEEDATCPSCSLVIKVIYDPDMFRAADDEVVKKLDTELKKLTIEK